MSEVSVVAPCRSERFAPILALIQLKLSMTIVSLLSDILVKFHYSIGILNSVFLARIFQGLAEGHTIILSCLEISSTLKCIKRSDNRSLEALPSQ